MIPQFPQVRIICTLFCFLCSSSSSVSFQPSMCGNCFLRAWAKLICLSLSHFPSCIVFLLARPNLCNGSIPNHLVHVVASNDHLYCVAASCQILLAPTYSVLISMCTISDHTHAQLALASNLQKFSPRNFLFHQFAKVFSLKSLLLYSTQ